MSLLFPFENKEETEVQTSYPPYLAALPDGCISLLRSCLLVLGVRLAALRHARIADRA